MTEQPITKELLLSSLHEFLQELSEEEKDQLSMGIVKEKFLSKFGEEALQFKTDVKAQLNEFMANRIESQAENDDEAEKESLEQTKGVSEDNVEKSEDDEVEEDNQSEQSESEVDMENNLPEQYKALFDTIMWSKTHKSYPWLVLAHSRCCFNAFPVGGLFIYIALLESQVD